MAQHLPVLLDEVVDLMNVRAGETYIDATFGRGGHARALLEALGPDGRLYAVDRDPEAIASARELAAADPRLIPLHAPFSALGQTFEGLRGQISGILLDLGISSPQVDDAQRGFSFRQSGPLDMRMDPGSGRSAAEWLAQAPEVEISDVLWQYGEERRSRQIARRIVETRQREPIETTLQLAEIVRACVYQRGSRIDPATRTFQAIRMRVNDELGELEEALEAALLLLAVGGRLLVIAFHSLEDRLVKRRFRVLEHSRREHAREGHLPVPTFRVLTPKPVMAGEDEKRANPRARSARLRALERVA